ncbi:MAG: hypothetical protein ACQGVC_18480 [Myxococcota bacterium]
MSDAPRRGAGSLGLLLLALLLLYTAFVHHGIGPIKPGAEDRWYTPSNFLVESDFTYAMTHPAGLAFVTLGLPALLLSIAVFATTRSALARALSVSCVVAALLFTFYGVVAPFAWQFFGWMTSAVLVLIALVMGFSLSAPVLAGRWLELSWPLRVACYLPFLLFVVAFLRNATGTDPNLPLAISPWPAVPVFGLEVGALFVAVGWIGTGVGVAAIARSGGRAAGAALGLAAGLATPALLLWLGGSLHLFPFRVGAGLIVVVSLACAVAIGLACGLRRRAGGARTPALADRARRIAVGAALVGIPLVAGQAWAYLDYYVTREVRARAIIDALSAHLERESLYPDDLDTLVHAGDLDEIPEPAIGFSFLYDGRFDYQSFGTSYLMEFPAPRWVQCAYTPAALYAEYEDEEYEEEFEEEELGESWSCPRRPPELW